MIKELHDMEENFKTAYRQLEEDPSLQVWENIRTELDKKKSRRKFFTWKITSFVFVLLVSGLLLYNTGIIKPGTSKKDKTPVLQNKNGFSDKSIPANGTNNSQLAVTPAENNKSGITTATNGNSLIVHTNNPGTFLFSSKATDIQKGADPNNFNGDNNVTLLTAPGFINERLNNSFTGTSRRLSFSFPDFKPSRLIINSDANGIPQQGKQTGKSKTNPPWSLTAYMSYDQTGYHLDSDDPLAATAVKHREVHEPSFSGGLLLSRQINNRFSLQSGLAYTHTQIGISPQKMYALQLPGGDIAYRFITSSGYAYIKLGVGQQPAVGDSITTSDAKHLLQQVSIPVNVKYKIGNKKVSVSPLAGIEANFITSAKVEVGVDLSSNREIVTVNKLDGIKKIYWSATAGAEVQYQLNKKISVLIRPVYKQALSPITKNNIVETYPRSFGVGAGVTIKF